MSNGYGAAMHIFTKVSKVPFHTYEVRFISVVFVDDLYLQGNNYKACLHNIENTIELLQNLGFTIHPTKSILTPTQRITFLGFVTDSVQMTLEITEQKKNNIHNLCLEILQKEKITLHTLASAIGNFVATIIHKIFEINSSFHVKQHTTGKVQFLFFSSFLLVLTKFSLWEEDWALGYNSMKF